MPRYLVTTFRTPNFHHAVLDAHYAYLAELRKQGVLQLAGPLSGANGGAYLLEVPDFAMAKEIGLNDPLHKTASSIVTVYEWNAT